MGTFVAVLAVSLLAGAAARTQAQSGPGPKAAPGTKAPPVAARSKARQAEDERARAAFERLEPAEQKDAVEYLRLECSHLATFQMDLVRYALGLAEHDAALFPEAQEPPVFDPERHAPAQPIPRALLPATARGVVKLREQVLGRIPKRASVPAWTYDHGARTLRRTAAWKDPARVFANALLGLPPDADLAEALVERALDDGSQQKPLAAFAHAYTDRAGGVYPGVTLYDAWASTTEIEMPDVDCLGIVHDVLGDWKRWVAPVPAGAQEPLYDTIGELFQRAHRHAGLRRALARCYLEGDAVLRDGYQGNLDNFHALWEKHRSTPSELAAALPKPDEWAEFLERWSKACHEEGEIYPKGLARHATLAKDAEAVRATALRVLEEFGAFERLTKPATARADTDTPR
jgi:hypothetical protein